MISLSIISSVLLVLIAVMIVRSRKDAEKSLETARKRSLAMMCVGVGLAFSLVYFEWNEIVFLPRSKADLINLLALVMWLPIVSVVIGCILGTVAVPTAIFYEKFAPLKLQGSQGGSIVVGAMVGALVALAVALLANAGADPENPFAFRPPIARSVLACGFAGGVGAFIWWRGMKALRT